MEKCYACGGKLVNDTKIIRYRSKHIVEEVKRCLKCNETFTSSKEANRVAGELHPNISKIFKDFFSELKSNLRVVFRRVL